jgi:hypothetical protein
MFFFEAFNGFTTFSMTEVFSLLWETRFFFFIIVFFPRTASPTHRHQVYLTTIEKVICNGS